MRGAVDMKYAVKLSRAHVWGAALVAVVGFHARAWALSSEDAEIYVSFAVRLAGSRPDEVRSICKQLGDAVTRVTSNLYECGDNFRFTTEDAGIKLVIVRLGDDATGGSFDTLAHTFTRDGVVDRDKCIWAKGGNMFTLLQREDGGRSLMLAKGNPTAAKGTAQVLRAAR
jgi:hypothetical protein